MPYYISNSVEGCTSGWAVISEKGTNHGCHGTKMEAIKQAVAISLSTGEKYEGDIRNKDKKR
jgi:hypothetical protein